MNTILKRTTNTIQIAEFWENEQLGKYNYNAPYQRMSVWTEEKQSFFIDSILRNFPVPPIFLHKKIDDFTGKQTFDVIDGKQRLTSLKRFINNEIPATSEEDGETEDKLSGVYFNDLSTPELNEYKKHFWRYELQIQYVDTEDSQLIDTLFDRLNRNGEPLSGQELRRAKYHATELWQSIEELSEIVFWKDRISHYDLTRMEDKEFISELLFAAIEQKPLGATSKILDVLYEQYKNDSAKIAQGQAFFKEITEYLIKLEIEYDFYSIKGVSHVYGLWCFALYCTEKKIPFEPLIAQLNTFYSQLKDISNTPNANTHVLAYKKSMSSGTKSEIQRKRRVEALIHFMNL